MASAPLYHPYDHRRALTVRLGQGTGHEPAWRSPFWRDRARLIHSAAFRRLQGKTQLFAGLESDFFRNRLTHSLEVAQIAVTIARKLNADLGDAGVRLNEDLIEFAALAHDLGHPPFGHTGEAVLDHEMRQHGGFEGNAQTLRILCRLEKKLDDERAQIDQRGPVWYRNGKDAAVGLNLCSRTLASILKYDRAIPLRRTAQDELVKGYYLSELPVVLRIKRDLKVEPGAELQVVECQIMEIADDIAYSTYDLEDAFKGGLLNPLDVLYPDDTVATDVARRVSAELDDTIAPADVRQVLRFLFGFLADPHQAPGGDWRDWYFNEVGDAYGSAENIAAIGFYRTWLTSALVNHFVHAVDLQLDRRRPLLSRVRMQRDQRIQVSVLKQVAYVQLITSPRLRMVAHRGEQVVRSIFQALSAKDGALLPADFYQRFTQASALQRPRVICDFIAGMTDRYATELYARLSSDVFTTMFKPL